MITILYRRRGHHVPVIHDLDAYHERGGGARAPALSAHDGVEVRA